MRTKPTLLFAASLVAGALAIGCGDDDIADETLSKAEFVTRANAICTEGTKELDKAGPEYFGGELGLKDNERPTAAQLAEFTQTKIVPGIQGQVDEIRALGAPEGDEEEVEALLDAAQQGADKLDANPELLAEDEQSGPDNPFKEANALAIDYGLKVCGGATG